MAELSLLSQVAVSGLVKAPELNGQRGAVLGRQAGRYLVRLEGCPQAKSLKRENLEIVDGGPPLQSHVEITGLVGAAELNGKHGVVVGQQGERFMVQIDGEEQAKALKSENLGPLEELPPLSRAGIGGLQAAPELNGKRGCILGRQGPRYTVLAEELGQAKSLKHRSLALDAEAAAATEAARRPEGEVCLICRDALWGEDGAVPADKAVADLVCHHPFHSKCLEMHQRTERHASIFGERRCCPLCGVAVTFWGAWKEVRTKWQAPCYWVGRLLAVLKAAVPAPGGALWRDVAEAVRCAEGLSEEGLQEALHGHGPPFADPLRRPPGGAAACCKVALTGGALQKALELGAHPRVRASSENEWQGLPCRGLWHVVSESRAVGGVLPEGTRVFLASWGVPPDARCTRCRRSLREGWQLCEGPCRAHVDTLYCSAGCREQDLKAHQETCDRYRKRSWEAPDAVYRSV